MNNYTYKATNIKQTLETVGGLLYFSTNGKHSNATHCLIGGACIDEGTVAILANSMMTCNWGIYSHCLPFEAGCQPVTRYHQCHTSRNQTKISFFAIFDKKSFTSTANLFYIFITSQEVEPRNSNKYKWRIMHAYLQRVFLYTLYTHQNRATSIGSLKNSIFAISMMTCNRKGLALCYDPLVVVFEPVTRYRQSLETKAITSINQVELLTVIYIFVGIERLDLSNQIQKIYINANSEQKAREIIAKRFVAVYAGQINPNNSNTKPLRLLDFVVSKREGFFI